MIITAFVTLDGVVDSPGGGPHPRAGSTFRQVPFDEAAHEIEEREQQEAAAMPPGRVGHDDLAPARPATEESVRHNAMPEHVVSSTLEKPERNSTSVLRPVDVVAQRKEFPVPRGGRSRHHVALRPRV